MNNEITINALMSTHFFRIPIYQRSYVWTKKNWEALWQDILAVVSGKYPKHFIGSIIYSKESEEGGDNVNLVIDGQQRLTTFTLLAAAVCYWLANKQGEYAKEKLVKFKEAFLFKEMKVGTGKVPFVRLRPADFNRGFFEKILDPLRLQEDLPDQFSSKESQVYGAFNYFKDEIEKYSKSELIDNENTEEQQVDRVADLVTTAFENMWLIPMILGNGDDAQRIFECMNYRSKILEQSDLIRNFVLQSWQRKKRLQFHDIWEKMEKAAVKHNDADKPKEDKVPEFFRDYLSMREGRIINEKDLFDTFKTGKKYDFTTKNGKRSEDKMENILREILRFAGYYEQILNPLKTQSDAKFDKEILQHLWYINHLPQARPPIHFCCDCWMMLDVELSTKRLWSNAWNSCNPILFAVFFAIAEDDLSIRFSLRCTAKLFSNLTAGTRHPTTAPNA